MGKEYNRGVQMIHLFIDTNIYLTFYHFSDDVLEELKKLAMAINKRDIKLYVSGQVIDEFNRNRETKIADALKRFEAQSLPSQFPNICRSYEEYSIMRNHLEGFRIAKASLLDKLRSDIENKDLGADKIISDIFNVAEKLDEPDELINIAIDRVNRGNPPGKPGAYGDAINWLVLMKSIPKGEDLYLLTDDKDYISRLDSNKLCDYLKTEWEKEQESSVYVYRKLSEFFREKYPDIKLASELEKQLAIDAFINSPNFVSTHVAIKNLSKYPDFSDSEVNEIAQAAVRNRQIYWIVDDPDVESFVSQIFEGREDIISPDIFKEYREIYSSVEEGNSEEDDIPF